MSCMDLSRLRWVAIAVAIGGCGGSGSDAGSAPGGTGAMLDSAGSSAGSTAPSAGKMATAGTSGALPIGGSSGIAAAGHGGSATAAAGAGGAAGERGAGAGGSAGAAAGAGGAGGGPASLPPITDYTQMGPFETTMESNTGPGGNYTIFRPDPLGKDGFLHAPIIFGPGIITTPSNYRTLLTHLASHGFVTICVNSLTGGPNAPGNLQAMKEGLDWLIAQNGMPGTFQGKLAVNRAVTMGYSIGATASVQLSSHEAIMTTVVIHGHNTSGDPHGPVLLITGTMDVIDDMRDTAGTLTEAPAILVALPIGHLDVLTELGARGRYIAPITAWLRYWVNGDDAAKRYFWGDGCEMCTSPWIAPEPNAAWKAQTL